jgi:3-deoxy-manno-octulosonate cytidylyltransferase (CMP-KDO synthetase)
MKIAAVIPARLASSRFPRKVLLPIEGLPMVEHVRRRALLCEGLSEVVVATCDTEVADMVASHGGRAVMTADTHQNGTTRVAEAIAAIDCTHVILLQGDEPLMLPRHVQALAAAMRTQPDVPAWNLVAAVGEADEMDRHSFVKCAVAQPDRILYCFRRSPYFSHFSQHREYARKMLGIIAYRRDFLLQLTALPSSPAEKAESIEQMRILENGFPFHFVEVAPSLPSINEQYELNEVLVSLQCDAEQQALLVKILAQPRKN